MNDAMAQVRALYAEHGPGLLRYLHGLTGRREIAEDLLQDTFVQAMRGVDGLVGANSPRAWLFAIARHLGINAIQRRRTTAALPEALAAAPVDEGDPRCEAMRAAIGELPEGQREALQLRLRDELTYEEIAQVLGVPVGTVRSRLHNAVKNLRERLMRDEAKER
jgi:RNA polymerase sigma-70 factor, ECF subfamily